MNNALNKISLCMSCFVIGFINIAAVTCNYVKADLRLSSFETGCLPAAEYMGFLIGIVIAGMATGRTEKWKNLDYGMKVMLTSLTVTAGALSLPLLGESFALMLTTFSLIGLCCAIILRVLCNTVMACCYERGWRVSDLPNSSAHAANEKGCRISVSWGIGLIAFVGSSILSYFLASLGAANDIPSFGYDCRILFSIYLIIDIFTIAIFSILDSLLTAR